jgi:hypothetical protein
MATAASTVLPAHPDSFRRAASTVAIHHAAHPDSCSACHCRLHHTSLPHAFAHVAKCFQMFQRYVASVSLGYCKSRFGCYMCCNGYTYVASVYSKYFIYFERMLYVFVSRCCICCSGYTHMLQAYDLIVSSSVSEVCCSKCFMIRCRKRAQEQAFPTCVIQSGWKRSQCARGKPSGHAWAVPTCIRAGNREGSEHTGARDAGKWVCIRRGCLSECLGTSIAYLLLDIGSTYTVSNI